MQSISRQAAVHLLRSQTKGKFFGVKFKKRTDGTIRVINGRMGVHKYANGGQMRYNPEERDLILTYDRKSVGEGSPYRMIPIEGIISICAGNEKYEVSE